MAANPSMLIRIAATNAELKKALAEGGQAIHTTTAAMAKMAASFSGQKLIQSAHNVVAAIGGIENVSKLTRAEQDRVNATLTRALEKYQALGREAPKAMRDIADATARVATVTPAATQASFTMASALQGAVAGATATATAKLAGLGAAIVSFASESAARGNQLRALHQTFTSLSGGAEQASVQMNAMRRGSMGLVDDLALLQAGNRSMLLGLNLSAGQMGDLAKTATVLGRAMGQDVTKSLDDMITALGRSSPMILDNLGLSVKVGEANEAYAAKLGKAASALTEAEKKQAFMNAAMDAAREKVRQLGEPTLTASEHIAKLWTGVRNLGDAAGNLVTNNAMVRGALFSLSSTMEYWATTLREGPTKALEEYRRSLGFVLERVKEADLAFLKQGSLSRGPGLAGDDLFAAMNTQTKDELDRVSKAIQRANELAAARDGLFGFDTIRRANTLAESLKSVDEVAKMTADNKARLREEVLRALEAYQALGKDAPLALLQIRDATTTQLLPSIDFTQRSIEALKAAVGNLFNTMVPIYAQYKQAVDDTRTAEQLAAEKREAARIAADKARASIGALAQSLANLSDIMGGKALGALAEFVGAMDAGVKSFDAFRAGQASFSAGGFTNMFAGVAGMASGILGMVGTVVSLAKSWFGVSAAVQKSREELKEFQATLRETASQAQINETAGKDWALQLVVIRDAYLLVGKTAEEARAATAAMWDTDNPERSKAAIAAINRVLERQKEILAEQRRELAGMQDELKALAEEATIDWKKMEEAAKRYGVDLASLGPQFQSGRLHASAQQIWNDFQLLKRGGADVGGILVGMKEEIAALVNDSIQFGTSIPENFRPLIAELIRSGQLLDAQGNKITDMSEIEFGDPIVARLDVVAARMKELVDLIAKLAEKLSRMPNPDAPWADWPPPPIWNPGDTQPQPYPGDASSGAGFTGAASMRGRLAGSRFGVMSPAAFSPVFAGGSGGVVHAHIHVNKKEIADAVIESLPGRLKVRGGRS